MIFRIAVLSLSAGLAMASATEWELDSRAVWHGNVTNADVADDRLAALQWKLDFTGSGFRALSGNQRLRYAWRSGVEFWPRYDGLDRVTTGPELTWSRKFGLGPQAPVFSVRMAGSWEHVRETPRSGWGGELALAMRQRWGADWQGAAGVQWTRFAARGMAFNHAGREYFLQASRVLGEHWHLTAELRERDGDVISYTTPPRPDLVQAGKVLTLLDTFDRGTPLLAYYFPADTTSGAIEVARMLNSVRAIFWRFEYRDTVHNNVRYRNQISTVGFRQGF